MNVEERITALDHLSRDFDSRKDYWDTVIHRASASNSWFTPGNIGTALKAIRSRMLDRERLKSWVAGYPKPAAPKNVGLIMAGNLPLVGFADWLAVFVSGHNALVKCSDKDNVLFPAIMQRLNEISPEAGRYTTIVERLKDYDAVIATGSNNTAVYFESYFSNVPHIIRRNRTSIAVIHPNDNPEVLALLNRDIHSYFGLGCRNVSKLYLPEGFDIQLLMRSLEEESDNILFNKYKNNFDYNLSIYMLNKVPFYTDNNIILLEDESLFSRIACLHYEWYTDTSRVTEAIKARLDDIQCIVSSKPLEGLNVVAPGTTQQPALNDYADHVDTMEFLSKL